MQATANATDGESSARAAKGRGPRPSTTQSSRRGGAETRPEKAQSDRCPSKTGARRRAQLKDRSGRCANRPHGATARRGDWRTPPEHPAGRRQAGGHTSQNGGQPCGARGAEHCSAGIGRRTGGPKIAPHTRSVTKHARRGNKKVRHTSTLTIEWPAVRAATRAKMVATRGRKIQVTVLSSVFVHECGSTAQSETD